MDDQLDSFFCRFRFFEASRKAGDISDEAIISKNERPTGESSFNGNEDIVPIDGEVSCFGLLE